MEERYYDNSSIAARSKQEQLMKEAEEYRLRRHIIAIKKNKKLEKAALPEKSRRHAFQPHAAHRPAPAQ
jgi:hypothetical protein